MTVPPLTGLILAGGKSSRFGTDKASALLRGRPLLQWVVSGLQPVVQALVIVKAPSQQLPPIDVTVAVTVVDDEYDALGPLAGLVTGFGAVTTELCFATACDAPLLSAALVEFLAGLAHEADVVVPNVEGFMQPLAAVYRPSTCRSPFVRLVALGALRIVPAYAGLRTIVVSEDEVRRIDPELRSFRNANRPERLAEIEDLLDSGE
ncbi:MAG: molybdenum cofactor guanylyltransferase [Anaerolineaceae bacterium]